MSQVNVSEASTRYFEFYHWSWRYFTSIEVESLLDVLERKYSEILNYDEIVTRKKYDQSQSFMRKIHYLVWLMCLDSNSSFYFWQIHLDNFIRREEFLTVIEIPSMSTARVVSWDVPDQTGVLFLSLVGKFEKSERFARAKHVAPRLWKQFGEGSKDNFLSMNGSC